MAIFIDYYNVYIYIFFGCGYDCNMGNGSSSNMIKV